MADEVTPVQRARQMAAALALKEGRHTISLACSHCEGGVFMEPEEEFKDEDLRQLKCIECGRLTSLHVARRIRRARIKSFIEGGIDIPLTPNA